MADNVNVPEFIRLFTSHEARLSALALSLIPNWADAEEVLQQSNLIMFKKFDQFQIGTSFFAWASRIVQLEAKTFRRRRGREKLCFSDEFLELVEHETVELENVLVERERLLGICMSHLKKKHRQILYLRYQRQQDIDAVATAVGSSVAATYKALERIYKWLSDCVERRLTALGLS